MHPMRLVSVLYASLASLSLPLGIFSIALIYKTTAREQRAFGYYLINLQFWTLLYDVLAGFAVQPVFMPFEQCILSSGFTRHLSDDYSIDLVVVTMQLGFGLCSASLLSLVAHRYGIHIFNAFSQVFIGKRSFLISYFFHLFTLSTTLCAFIFLEFRPTIHDPFVSRFCSLTKFWSLASFMIVILAVSLLFLFIMLFATHQIFHNLESSRAIMRTRTYSLNIKTTYSLFALIAAFFVFKLLPLTVWVSANWIPFNMNVPITASHLLTVLGSALQSFLILYLVPPYPVVISKMWRWTRLRFPRNKLSYVQSSDSIKY